MRAAHQFDLAFQLEIVLFNKSNILIVNILDIIELLCAYTTTAEYLFRTMHGKFYLFSIPNCFVA